MASLFAKNGFRTIGFDINQERIDTLNIKLILRAQQKAYQKAHKKLKKALIEATNTMTKTELYKATRLSRVTINRHLNHLLNTGEVKKFQDTYIWKEHYKIFMKGLKADSKLIEDLETAMKKAANIVDQLSTPTNIFKLKAEIDLPLSEEAYNKGYITKKELKKILEHKQKIFKNLRETFFKLAIILTKADAGLNFVKEDLSNLTIKFENNQPTYMLIPDLPKKYFF